MPIFLNRDPNNRYFLTCTFINNLKEGSLLWRYKENHKNHVNVTKKLSKIPLDFEKSFSTTEEGLIKRKNNEDNLEYSERPNKLQMSLKGLLETV
ncbi:hypothetical protein Glove_225g60 [Diversispora epigaea]|uniref:Uncharacterized protein n=1 Tax=Diversispora epigaea TaxID=1348612 RepID=A0A397IN00_9GLOM|nr:hypothetical protein Glove_225g60 [Diversispora epigaea]